MILVFWGLFGFLYAAMRAKAMVRRLDVFQPERLHGSDRLKVVKSLAPLLGPVNAVLDLSFIWREKEAKETAFDLLTSAVWLQSKAPLGFFRSWYVAKTIEKTNILTRAPTCARLLSDELRGRANVTKRVPSDFGQPRDEILDQLKKSHPGCEEQAAKLFTTAAKLYAEAIVAEASSDARNQHLRNDYPKRAGLRAGHGGAA